MTISVVGLGYVGLPLAVAFSSKYKVIGYDLNSTRIDELKTGNDRTLEVNNNELSNAIKNNNIEFTANLEDIRKANFYIVAVPTPVDENNVPNLKPLLSASESIGKVISKGDIVVFESTVYPGATEEVCVPIIEKVSKLKFNKDFFCGYSPERINPGDKEHTITKILKITSGSTPESAQTIDKIYSSVIEAGTYKASSIKVAEAAKVIENTQRDINIAFVNELAMLFNKLGIDTNEVLDAASTKWNFINFRPGLVGGHCIGVDPFYLTHKALEVGYHPEMILAGRRINDNMSRYVAKEIVKMMIKNDLKIKDSKVLILGITFKENCPDIRNTKVVDMIKELNEFGIKTDVYDPWADKKDVKKYYNIDILNTFDKKDYSCIVIAVAHEKFKNIDLSDTAVYDLKNIYKDSLGRL